MIFRAFRPRPPLDAFVEDVWLYEDYAGGRAFERILPSGTVEMVFNLREDAIRIYDPERGGCCRSYPGAVVSGPYTRPFLSDAAEETSIMGVHFRPGGARAVLGLPVTELADTHVALAALWGPAATLLRERLCAAPSPGQRWRILEQALRDRLAGVAAPHRATRQALRLLGHAQGHAQGQARLRDVAAAVNLSQRRLIEVFAADVGLTPKLFGRIQRFQHAVALQDARLDGAALADACGYCDQSHFIRDFVAFSGVNPRDFRQHRASLAAAGLHVKRHHLPVPG